MSTVASPPQAAPAPAEAKPGKTGRAKAARAPRPHRKRLFQKFMEALEERVREIGEEPQAGEKVTRRVWLMRHPRLGAWLLLIIFCVEFLAFASWGVELLVLLVIASFTWWATGGERRVIAVTARQLAAVVLAGLTILCTALCALNSALTGVRPATVARSEQALARLRLEFAQLTSLSVVPLLIVGTLLLALAVFYTNLDAARKYKRAQSAIGSYHMLLPVLCSLVIYAQSPLQNEVGVSYRHLTSAYRAALDEQWHARSQIAAVAPVQRSLAQMPASQQAQLGGALRQVYLNGSDPATASAVETAVFETAAEQSNAAMSEDLASDLAEGLAGKELGGEPATPHQLDEGIHATAAAEEVASRANQVAHQAASVVISTLVRLAELASPVPFPTEGAQMVAESLFENWAELAEPTAAQAGAAVLGGSSAHALHVLGVSADTDPAGFLHHGAVAGPERFAAAAAEYHAQVAAAHAADTGGDSAGDGSDALDHVVEDLHF